MSIEIVFIMVGTTHTGNLGAAARAMKTMGFTKLRLVDTCSHLSAEALARSSGANDVLQQAQSFGTLKEAIADCTEVIGTSARARNLAVPLRSAEQIATQMGELATADEHMHRVAMVFGQERSGLSNEALDLCTRLLRIPCNPEFSSLNLGSAVQVVSYELSKAVHAVPQGEPQPMPGKWKASDDEQAAMASKDQDELPATSEAMEHFFEHLDRVMVNTGFLDPDNPRHLRRKVRRYFESNRPSSNELAMFRGILSATENPRNRTK